MDLINLFLPTYFQFGGQVYQQIKGTPLGSLLSGLITQAITQCLESIALPHRQLKVWIWYEDDTFVIFKKAQL